MSTFLGYGQTSSGDTTGGKQPVMSTGVLSSGASPRDVCGLVLAPLLIMAGVGLTFMKNVLVLTRDFWAPSQGTPYSGQIFPTGGNSGGPGQVFPF